MQLLSVLCAALSVVTMLIDASPAPAVATQATDTVIKEIASNSTNGFFVDGIEARAPSEEYWFRYEAADVTTKATILELAARPGQKDYDDQAYKWISTDASKVDRPRSGKIPAIYVLRAGTRARILQAAKDFDTQVAKQQATEYVQKVNKHDDVGIQGIARLTAGQATLEAFRGEVRRSVFKPSNSGSSQFLTWTGATKSRTATQADQALLDRFWN
ncbi:hypothetical protein EVG20_g9696 [Dentipellis fragilis]|uniref:Inhibitor I9 domain-containing protein n=1 Tax=Dentipellis fragilis TaxID=205917 RepID=A0A4Y9XYL3_9AGAM|nr:hypothetical protein EVG20_g9696 [Dentipellis fragilis]